jgi:FliI/YscN family ATPase
VSGQVHRLLGGIAESRGLLAPVGARCEIYCRDGRRVPAEVIGFRDELALVAPCADTRGMAAGDRIEYRGERARVRAGAGLLGRVVDADGVPLDGRGRIHPCRDEVPLHGSVPNPLERRPVERRMETGIRAVDALFTVGCGQRLGIFAGSGLGKSFLLGMIARGSSSAVIVLGLIGERGREVRDFVDRELGAACLARSVVVAATAEEPALKRLQAALAATAIAEYFRDQSLDVLLLVDSLTRVAMAQRELGLAMGEPPAAKGYPPSVFAFLPRLLERAGPGRRGSITGFYSVLVEGDDRQDPVADSVRATLDGHLWLSRELAEKGHFPALDPLASLSRVHAVLASEEHQAAARQIRADLARYQDAEELIRLGAYVPGGDAQTDRAIALAPALLEFLRQRRDEVVGIEETLAQVLRLGGGHGREVTRGPDEKRRKT